MVKKNQACLNLAQMQIIINSRVYWREKTVWLRLLMSSNYSGLGISEPIFSHLLDISNKLTNIMSPIFGREIAEQYNELLTQNNIWVRELIEAQLRNDTVEINQIVNSLYENNERRAAFLSSINPFWYEVQWRNLMDTYLNFTIEEANALASGDFNRSVFLFDRLMAQSDLMGDYFAYGLYSYIILSPQRPVPNLIGFRIDPTDQCATYSLMNFLYNIRMFWFDLAVWTRIYAIARTVSPEYAESAYAKLRQIPIQYGNLLKTVFDDELADELLVLIYEQIELIMRLVTAQIDGNVDEANRIVQRLYQNADDRVALFARINPHIDQDRWRNIHHSYLQSTIEEVTSFLTGDYDRNLTIFQRLLEESEHISNEFSVSLLTYLSSNQRIM